MAKNFAKISNGINFKGQSSAPTSPDNGDIYYDSTRNTFSEYINGFWFDQASKSDVASASSLTSANFTATVVQSSFVKLTGSTAGNVHGLTASGSAKTVLLYNGTSVAQIIKNQSATEGTAANRITTSGGADVTISSGASALLVYDITAATWVLVSVSGSGGLSAWTSSTAYLVGAVVTYEKNAYIALTAHTSSSTFEVDVATSKWRLLNTPTAFENLMLVGNNFEDGDAGGWTGTGCATVTNGLPASVGTGGNAFSSSNGGRALGANTTAPATTSSSPINDTYSLNLATSGAGTIGDGYISQIYPLSSKYQAKALTFKFSYKVASGTPAMPGTSSNTYAVAIYDVANNAWFGVAGQFNFVQSTGVGTCTGTFQTAINSTGFQVFIYSPVAPTGASSLLIDDLYVGPQPLASGPSMSDWVAYTPIFTGFGTPTGVSVISRRVGDTLEIQGIFTTGTVTASAATVSLGFNGLNGGLTIDSSVPGATLVGQAGYSTNNTVLFEGGILASGLGTTLAFSRDSSTTSVLAAATGSAIVTSSSAVSFNARIKISGWSSNSVMSSDTDTREVSASFTRSTAFTYGTTATTTQKLLFNNVLKDTHGAGGGASADGSWVYTVPVSGDYMVSISIPTTTGTLANVYFDTFIFIGTNIFPMRKYVANASAIDQTTMTVQGPALAGQTIYVSGSSTYASGTAPTWNYGLGPAALSIQRLSGPATIAATESVNGSYTDTAGSAISALATYTYATKIRDSHNVYSGGTLTIPVSGEYRFSASMITAGVAFVAGNSATISIQRNGTQIGYGQITAQASVSQSWASQASVSYPCLAGDTIVVKCSSSVATTANTGVGLNTFCWERVGN